MTTNINEYLNEDHQYKWIPYLNDEKKNKKRQSLARFRFQVKNQDGNKNSSKSGKKNYEDKFNNVISAHLTLA